MCFVCCVSFVSFARGGPARLLCVLPPFFQLFTIAKSGHLLEQGLSRNLANTCSGAQGKNRSIAVTCVVFAIAGACGGEILVTAVRSLQMYIN